jgi:surfeit locus 1 family protein
MLFVNRIRDGSPGVHIITPLRPDSGLGGDTVLMVDRGWVYSPDGATIDQTKWRESDHMATTGYVQEFSPGAGSAESSPDHPERLRWLDPAAAARRSGHPVVDYYVVVETDDASRGAGVPARIPRPALDDGPHLSYAIQWFAFAAIALLGPFLALYVIPRRRS